jgi:hypothetical protein
MMMNLTSIPCLLLLAIKEKKELFLNVINSLSRSEGNMEICLLLVLILNHIGKI